MKWFNIYSPSSYLLLATAVYPRLRCSRCRFSHFSENPWFLYGEWASTLALFFHFLRPKEVSSLIFLSHTVHIQFISTSCWSYLQNISKTWLLLSPPAFLAWAAFLSSWAALMSPYLCACFHFCCSPQCLSCILYTRGRNKCFQTFHSSAQKASSVIQSCWVCLKRPTVTVPARVAHWPYILALFTPHQPQASSLFLKCPKHFRLRAFALPAPSLPRSFLWSRRRSLLTAVV